MVNGSNSETRMQTESLKKHTDGCDTRMLRRANMKIQDLRSQDATSRGSYPEIIVNHLLLWEPTHGVQRRGGPTMTYVDSLGADMGLNQTGEKVGLMVDRVLWR